MRKSRWGGGFHSLLHVCVRRNSPLGIFLSSFQYRPNQVSIYRQSYIVNYSIPYHRCVYLFTNFRFLFFFSPFFPSPLLHAFTFSCCRRVFPPPPHRPNAVYYLGLCGRVPYFCTYFSLLVFVDSVAEAFEEGWKSDNDVDDVFFVFSLSLSVFGRRKEEVKNFLWFFISNYE